MSEQDGIKNIDYRFKILYALGIVFVAAGHCGRGGVSLLYDWFPPGAFHLGLFVFSSGYFYKSQSEDNIVQYIFKKVKKLILPMYLWNFFYAGVVFSLKYVGFTIGWGGVLCRKAVCFANRRWTSICL